MKDDTISRREAINALEKIDGVGLSAWKCDVLLSVDDAVATIKALPPVKTKGYTKADYIMALHKEYGVDFARAEEAHNRALEYLRSTAMMKG